MPVVSGVSASHVPVPSSANLATESEPLSSRSAIVAAFRIDAIAQEAIEELAPLVVAQSTPPPCPSAASVTSAFSCLKRPSAVRFLGVDAGSSGSISTT